LENVIAIARIADHLTTLFILKPLKTKRAEEITYNLKDFFATFGAPAILHSDDRRDFVNNVINELHTMWGDVKIVHGNQDIVRHRYLWSGVYITCKPERGRYVVRHINVRQNASRTSVL